MQVLDVYYIRTLSSYPCAFVHVYVCSLGPRLSPQVTGGMVERNHVNIILYMFAFA